MEYKIAKDLVKLAVQGFQSRFLDRGEVGGKRGEVGQQVRWKAEVGLDGDVWHRRDNQTTHTCMQERYLRIRDGVCL